MLVSWNFKKLVPTMTVGAVAFTLSTEVAYGFFPPIPLGSGPVSVSPPPTAPVQLPPVSPPVAPPVVPPTFPPVPPVPPPPFTPPPVPPVFVPPVTSPPVHVPQATPEPATVVSGLIGLAALGGAAWRRRKAA